jgi:cell division septation protein DedD
MAHGTAHNVPETPILAQAGPIPTPHVAPAPVPTPSPILAPPPVASQNGPEARPTVREKALTPKPAQSQVVATVATPAPAQSGRFRIQLGAFSEAGRAQALWKSLTGRVSGLSAYQPAFVTGGGLTRLQVGQLASAADAERLCARIKAMGAACLVK